MNSKNKAEFVNRCSDNPMLYVEMYSMLYIETGNIDFAICADTIINNEVEDEEYINTIRTQAE